MSFDFERMVECRGLRIWVTNYGDEIPLAELSDEHLVNIQRFLQSKKDELNYHRAVLENEALEGDADSCSLEYHRERVAVFEEWAAWSPIIGEEVARRKRQ